MSPEIRSLIRAGIVGQLCLRQHRIAKTGADWSDTRFYAIREFPDIPIPLIDELIEVCRRSYSRACEYNNECRK
jgi:hypothetical protein